MTQPILYSFRRCPYAIRARLAIASAGSPVELREVVLRQKPEAFLQASPSGTVPCLVTAGGVIDESLDVMLWALGQKDPEGWLSMPDEGFDWIARNDGSFKSALDRTKYAGRYPGSDPEEQRGLASAILAELDQRIDGWIFGRPTLADYAILPFVRQFAFVDKTWFDAQPWPDLQLWLENFLASDRFADVMVKYEPWQVGDPPVRFP
ncbi:MAG: glutathione S-transferase [Hoeflea sp.]|uniref:glutathione S-transferase n=1 Tax=Hoeflea sp. TaxID=1940281 RepID=UPI001D1DBD07|nr:glutathione S-transferase [Hoeflea sp.]MBU4531166.1 glutathione S-transferase [Alphaproteobacteria bacterium]MBU4545772.1 glutathione S-transferase [Alphaproteobacteria bacterium]MBU4550741.1 glutathione S-transferase [Alphaproteobacteria bacterium]MBV1724443.1 glutathione S-transferase [Hoeflea sp.]MBV1760463.1 glutathione S-transferase [Hoeflea sp.]